MNKKALKIFVAILLIDIIENLILLYFFGIELILNNIVMAVLYSVILTFIIDKFVIKEKNET